MHCALALAGSLRRSPGGPLALLSSGLFAVWMVVPCGAQSGAEDRTTQAKAAASHLQDAFVRVADELEPAVVTITAKKTVKPKTGPGNKPDDNVLDDLGFGKTRRGYRAQGTGSGVIFTED